MKSDRPVAIVGGGFSGTILAAQLARRGISSVLIDGSGRMGRGVAYSTTEGAHLLNVRAEGMSAWAGEPAHFAEAFAKEGGEPRSFAQRRQFGRYLGQILDDAVASGKAAVEHATATSATRTDGGWRVELDNGQLIEAAGLALAVGNQEPEGLSAFTGSKARVHVVTAKAGLIGMTRALATDLADDKITVNLVSPGLIGPRRAAGKEPQHHLTHGTLTGERGKPEDIAAMVRFLCGPGARYVTGQTIHVNGGAYMG